MPTLLLPNSELVAVAWLQGIPYLGSRVATSLPTDNSTWSAAGFVTAVAAGGNSNSELPWRMPAIGVTCWGAAPGSGKPPWNLASQLAEQIREAVLAHTTAPRRVTLPSGYENAFVRNVRLLTEPTRAPGDVSSYARYTLDLAIWWVRAG
jgi:hypothetical protein